MSTDQYGDTRIETTTQEGRMWAMFLHLSLLAGFMIPFAGLIVSILIWQSKKEDLPEIDAHGKVMANWLISELIYGAIGVVLFFLFIGIPILMALGIAGIAFPIIGGIKANNGEVWKYPLAISFFK